LYSTFVETIENRRSMVYVGGNDGMLHGFYAKNKVAPDTSGGEEVFAYVPSMISDTDNGGQGLHKLSSVGYEGAAYVDGSPNVSDVFVNRALEDARWRTYLVGGLRAGGKGIYVLDVTNPNDESGATAAPRLSNAEDITLAERIVVNEFTHEKLGHVYGRPQIGKMNNGRWAAIVGNGYNSSSTEAGTASLFVIYLDKPTEISTDPDTGVVSYQITDTDGDGILNNGNGDYSIITASTGTWVKCADEGGECVLTADAQVRYGAGVNYSYRTEPFEAGTHECSDSLIAASTEDSPVCEYSDSNGLSQPEIVDLDGDGTIDRIYAGDLHGNMWVFKTQNIAANEWQVHSVVDNIPKPLFTACSAALTDGYCDYDQRQPITTKPLVRNNPIRTNSNTEPNKLVFFGTGQYLAKLDPESDVHQSFYTVWDAGTESSGLSKENLTTQYIFLVGDGSDDRLINSSTVNYNTTITRGFGWYYEYLPGDSSGSAGAERVVLSPLLFGNILLFQTLIPNAGLCNASAGSGYIMAVDPLTGGNPPIDIFGRGGDANVAGVKVGSVIVGGSVVKTDDGVELKIKTADGDIGSTNLTPSTSGESGNSTAPGELFHNKGRKSWSILR
jgi:Tfp pilus tip-associated adhesin PilY1